MHTLIALLIMLAGLFTVFCAAKNYDWFMEHRKARPLVALFGRTVVRLFYGALGTGLALFGLALLFRPELMANN